MATATMKNDLDKSGGYDDNNRNPDKSGIEPMLADADQMFLKASEIDLYADELKRHHLKSIANSMHDFTLKDDLMYKKLVARITSFFAKVENDRRKSRTDSAIKNRGGVPMAQQI